MTELSDLQFALLVTLPVLLFLLVIVVFPLGYAFWLSFHSTRFVDGARYSFCGFDNYIAAWQSPGFWNAVAVSLHFAMVSTVFTLGIGLMIALILARIGRGRGFIFSLAFLPWAISDYATGVIFRYVLGGRSSIFTTLSYLFGFNTRVNLLAEGIVIEGLALGFAWHLAPLVAFFLLAGIRTIPVRLYDLAELDHCGPWSKFRYVTLPYIRYSLFVFTTISCVFALKTFELVYLQTGGGPGIASATLTYFIYKESILHLNLGYGAAISLYLLLLFVALSLFLYVVWGRKEV